MASTTDKVRRLVIVLGDQLDPEADFGDDFDRDRDAVLMMEVREEATYVPQHKIRLALFFSAMRHYRDRLEKKGLRVLYSELTDRNNRGSFDAELGRWINKTRAKSLAVRRPGDYRVLEKLEAAADKAGLELERLPDPHFLCTVDEFADHAAERKTLLMERFYRWMRKRYDVLMDDDQPVGGRWNFDADNRKSFGKDGPGKIKAPRSFRPDDITKDVLAMVAAEFPDSPGTLEHFDYPVTHEQARQALKDFIKHRLANFGDYQDAMATGYPYLYHSRLSCVMNLRMLHPMDAIRAAEDAWRNGDADLATVEGFIRQILGWREYIRGVYWLKMPDYLDGNALDADVPAPDFLWTGETDMNCVHQSVEQLKDHAYAHHIQRLMVLGLFCLVAGVRPREVHDWHMSMYADAIDWVSLPNVLGMSQYADGGFLATKPYCASGNYINKMSDYCSGCRYNPKKTVGDDACPFTTLYWDFLSRNRQRLANNHRMGLQFKNLDRKSDADRRAIREQAQAIKEGLATRAYFAASG